MNQRDWIEYYLAEAQFEIEEAIHYNIGRRWTVDEEHPYADPMIAGLGYLVSGGVETTTDLVLGSVVDYTAEPAIVGPVATAVTDVTTIHIYHPGTDIEIDPSSITISGGSMTIEIPRCRLVDPDLASNSSAGLDYTDLANFSATVDIRYTHNTNTTPATLVYKKCRTDIDCTDEETTACIYVRKAKIGSVQVKPCSVVKNATLYKAKLSYYSGRSYVDSKGHLTDWGRQAQDAIIHLAHAKMPHEPCACDAASEMWERDREVIVDGYGRPRRGVSPFGPEEGAWAAYAFSKSMRLSRGAIL